MVNKLRAYTKGWILKDISNEVRGQECNLEPLNPGRQRRRQRRGNL